MRMMRRMRMAAQMPMTMATGKLEGWDVEGREEGRAEGRVNVGLDVVDAVESVVDIDVDVGEDVDMVDVDVSVAKVDEVEVVACWVWSKERVDRAEMKVVTVSNSQPEFGT